MIIIHKQGDLFDYFKRGEFDACAHQANCYATFGAGIARVIANKYPEAELADRMYYNNCNTNNKQQLGEISFAVVDDGVIYNLYGQDHYRGDRSTNYEMIYSALEKCRDHMIKSGLYSIGFPKYMSSGLAGGDWRIIETMIEVVFENSGIAVTVVELVTQ